MSDTFSTGQVAALLAVPEPKLNDLIRRGKINPAPTVVAGRRVWLRQHVAQAADHLGVVVQVSDDNPSASGSVGVGRCPV